MLQNTGLTAKTLGQRLRKRPEAQGAVIVRHDFCNVKTGINKAPLYDIDIPPPAEQLGEPSRLFREPTQSYLVQVSFVVKDAGTVDEGTHLF